MKSSQQTTEAKKAPIKKAPIKKTPIEKSMQALRTRLLEVYDLQMAASLLDWDQSTYMPPGGVEARGRQMALLYRLAHERFSDRMVGKHLDTLQPYADSLPYDQDEAALLRVTRRSYELAIRVPAPLLAEVANLNAEMYAAWAAARPKNDFAAVRPLLEKKLHLSRQFADCFPGYQHMADPLIALSDYGMTVAEIRPLFAQLQQWLTPLVKRIKAQPSVDDSFLYKNYPIPAQRALIDQVLHGYGYDFTRGRQDETHHPFMTKFSLGDVRITTRYYEEMGVSALFSSLHECGHAMYEQGIQRLYEGTPLAHGASSGVHESQSRLWENLVGRSRAFWQHFYPQFQTTFGDALQEVSLEAFYRAVNKVIPSLIRIEADEVTYNLHVIIRFELEAQLLEGTLAVQDLPAAWREAYSQTLGITPPDDSDGCLQDVHWYSGWIGGAFQGYTLGNLMSAQFYATALKAHPEIPQQIRQGNFEPLRTWLTTNVYQHGNKFTATELLQRATGSPLQVQPYQDYLTQKYGEIYQEL